MLALLLTQNHSHMPWYQILCEQCCYWTDLSGIPFHSSLYSAPMFVFDVPERPLQDVPLNVIQNQLTFQIPFYVSI